MRLISRKNPVLSQFDAAVDDFVQNAPQFDDIKMVGFKYYGPEGKNE